MKPDWTKHPRRDETDLAYRRHWILKTTDGRVIEHRSKVGLPTCFYAVAPMERLVGRHRTKRATMRAVERFVLKREGVAADHV
jgi:hypothetical protein